MTDHKFTDDEIIKTLNYCAEAEYCATCLARDFCKGMDSLMENSLALINRQKAEIEKLKDSRDRWKQIATDFDKASRETEKEIERLTTLAELGNMRANDYREMRNKLKKANAEIESLKKIGDDKTSEILRHATAIGGLHKQLETAKSEAYKEFAWRLKKKMYPYNGVDKKTYAINAYAVEKAIEDLVKEMMENDK